MRRWLPLLLILLLALPLVLLFQGWVRDVMLIELARLYWSTRFLVEGLPQVGVWGLVIVLVAFIAIGSLSLGWNPERNARRASAIRESQVEMLARWIDHADEAEYFQWSLAQHLGTLLCEVIAHREGTTPARVRRRLRAGELALPPDVEAYLQNWRPTRKEPAAGLSGLFSEWRRPASPSASLEQVVQFIEEQMEDLHETRF